MHFVSLGLDLCNIWVFNTAAYRDWKEKVSQQFNDVNIKPKSIHLF